ncbi:hypothetical protein VTN77DRAFT_256 [Rasamsonia byssochlamydoides]|uniref:uncharacterized protein n=1 Tax=Rasamsonia byssochlamydoides TaxID=89139 RepID=UPI0037432D3F
MAASHAIAISRQCVHNNLAKICPTSYGLADVIRHEGLIARIIPRRLDSGWKHRADYQVHHPHDGLMRRPFKPRPSRCLQARLSSGVLHIGPSQTGYQQVLFSFLLGDSMRSCATMAGCWCVFGTCADVVIDNSLFLHSPRPVPSNFPSCRDLH